METEDLKVMNTPLKAKQKKSIIIFNNQVNDSGVMP